MSDPDVFSERLRSAREMRKLTQIELGVKANLPSTSIAHFEAGSRKPSFANLRKLAETLEVTTDYLLGRAGDVLFRDIGKMSDYDRTIAMKFFKILAEKDSKVNKNLERSIIQQRAVRILNEYQLNKLPIDPKLIANKSNILVEPNTDCEEGVSGMLLRAGENYCIIYATYLGNQGFENFSIAHELGHYFLDGHPETIFQNSNIHKSIANFISDNEIERQADTFAANLLMPENLFKDRLTEYEKGMTCIEAMAKLCNTSLTATAIRYAELTEDKVIVMLSTNGIIDYCRISNAVFDLRELEIPKKGDRILKGTATERIHSDSTLMLKKEPLYQETDFRDWLECKKSKQAVEEAKGLGKYGKVLTVIT
jgi:Zn-dependent peptidase ImmA (M78 family)/DNA-binding XRE family transcriptional regulator